MKSQLHEKLNKYFAGKNVRQAILFGSQARSTTTKRSDYDIIIIQDTNKRFFDRYDYFNDIYNILGNQVDMLIYNPVEWEQIKKELKMKDTLT